MGRQIINSIECGYCHKTFKVATEDLEWEHIVDIGERDDDATLHDFAISQKVDCPHCGKANNIIYKTVGHSDMDLQEGEVMSMEPSALLQ